MVDFKTKDKLELKIESDGEFWYINIFVKLNIKYYSEISLIRTRIRIRNAFKCQNNKLKTTSVSY